MLQRLVEVRKQVSCDSAYVSLAEIIRQLLIVGYPTVELVEKSTANDGEDPVQVFEKVQGILIGAHLLDAQPPISVTKAGIRHLRVPNPFQLLRELPAKIRLDKSTDPAAVLLHAFLVLRIRYQATKGRHPTIRLEAASADGGALDTIFLVGDAFTERFPVSAELTSGSNGRVCLTLIGEPAVISGGLGWARADYVRSRDASLLLRPLREALEGPCRPLIIPRETRGALGTVRVRVPEKARGNTSGVRWLRSLQELKFRAGGELSVSAGALGEHFAIDSTNGGYLTSTGKSGLEPILPVRALLRSGAPESFAPELEDGSIAISLEPLGGGREIGANSYYYMFGHRGLVIDAGFDATRDGWLGLPAIERIARLDAVALTHAHLDHIGALPSLLATIPKVPVYCTAATLAVLWPQLIDSANVAGFRFEQVGEAQAVSRGLVDSIRPERFRVVEYNKKVEVREIPGLTIEFQDAGHIIGSACLRMEFGGASIVHTGDISVENQHLLRGMQIDGLRADHVVMEGTYSGAPKTNRQERRTAVDAFLAGIAERIGDGGTVLVPAFSLGRAQELVGILVDWNNRTGREVPIWSVGLVNELNRISAGLPEFLPGISGRPFSRVKEFPRLAMKRASDAERRDEYSRLFFEVAKMAPCVIIASHGMMMENTGSYFIGRAILLGDDPRHAIFLCGYMDPRTPGFRLLHQGDSTKIDYGTEDTVERTIPAERIAFYPLTAHASYEELIEVALGVPKASVTLIHGEGEGLDSLRSDLIERLGSAKREMKVRAPAIGERILIAYASPPEGWDVDSVDGDAGTESLATGRRLRASGLSIRGLSADRWALLPIGLKSVALALESDRIDVDRISRIELYPWKRNQSVLAYDRDRKIGDLSRIQWSEPGEASWIVFARDPDGRPTRARLKVFYGAALRATRTALDTTSPVLEVEVGGSFDPEFLGATDGRRGSELPVDGTEWNRASRVLKIRFSRIDQIGSIEDLHLSLRWPNGWIQRGPGLGAFSFEPVIDLQTTVLKVGVATDVQLRSTPRPSSAQFDGAPVKLGAESVSITPKRPGLAPLELEYRTDVGSSEWREAGVFNVLPAVKVEVPAGADADRDLDVTVREIDASFYGATLGIRLGADIRDEWKAGSDQHHWSGKIDTTDPLEVSVVDKEKGLVLWTGSIRVYSGLELDTEASLPVTTADGRLEAELTFAGPKGWSKEPVEEAFRSAGFEAVGWSDCKLRLRGTVGTIGLRYVQISSGARTINVRILTLSDLALTLKPSGQYAVGDSASVSMAGGELVEALESTDGGLISIEVTRVSPLFDNLSTRTVGNRIHFLHVGLYSVALVAGNRRLAETTAKVGAPAITGLGQAPKRVELSTGTTHEASVRAAQLVPYSATVVLSSRGGPHRILQDRVENIEQGLRKFVSERLAGNERVLVTWPGLTLGAVGGQLLQTIRREKPRVGVSLLCYPAPRGEIVSGSSQAVRLLHHRVLCCAAACSWIDRGDNCSCSKGCSTRVLIRTDNDRLWLECPKCGDSDRDLVLTLNGMRSANVQVLFADFRIAKYLMRGTGRRYAGAFGRSVRCSECHRLQPGFPTPSGWVKEELRRLLNALSSVWNPDDANGSIRRAAARAALRAPASRPSDVRRLEDALVGLVESKIIQDGHVEDLSALESGLSLCCQRPLNWSASRIGVVFLGVEELLSPAFTTSVHPELSAGQAGLRQFLSLAD